MMLKITRVLLLLALAMLAASISDRQISNMIKMEEMKPRSDFLRIARTEASTIHEVIVAVKQNNMDVLEEMLKERGTPGK